MNKYDDKISLANDSIFTTLISTTKEGKKKLSWRSWRWISVIGFHVLFVLSYYLDVQMLEGALTGSRRYGFHLTDPFMTLQVVAAYHQLPLNLAIGTITIVIIYFLIGGRSYCSWVCPYGLLSELGEKINRQLVAKKIIPERKFDHRVRYIFWALFLGLAVVSGYLVFEVLNIVGIFSRAIIYGWSVATLWIVAIFLVEVFYSQRAWCRYVCPVGTTYSFIGWPSATKVKWDDKCDHCGSCLTVCLVPHVLDMAKKNADNQGKKEIDIISGDCTLCGRCIDVCHSDALNYDTKLKKII